MNYTILCSESFTGIKDGSNNNRTASSIGARRGEYTSGERRSKRGMRYKKKKKRRPNNKLASSEDAIANSEI